MNFFKKDRTIEMQESIEELQEENSNLQKKVQDYQKTISGFVGVKTSYEAEKNKLIKKYELELSQLKQQIEMGAIIEPSYKPRKLIKNET